MQEMRPDIVEHYFKIIKSNSAFFYCCNKDHKKLISGEELVFNQYQERKGIHFLKVKLV